MRARSRNRNPPLSPMFPPPRPAPRPALYITAGAPDAAPADAGRVQRPPRHETGTSSALLRRRPNSGRRVYTVTPFSSYGDGDPTSVARVASERRPNIHFDFHSSRPPVTGACKRKPRGAPRTRAILGASLRLHRHTNACDEVCHSVNGGVITGAIIGVHNTVFFCAFIKNAHFNSYVRNLIGFFCASLLFCLLRVSIFAYKSI